MEAARNLDPRSSEQKVEHLPVLTQQYHYLAAAHLSEVWLILLVALYYI